MSGRLLEVTDCVFAAEQSVRRARETVEDLREVTRSALRVLDDAQSDIAHSDGTQPDRGGLHLEAAADHVGRLKNRCAAIGEINVELLEHLDRAAAALEHAGGLIDELNGAIDPQAAQTVAQLRPRLAAVSDMVEVARPMSQSLVQNITTAHAASQEVTAAALARPRSIDPHHLGLGTRTAGQYLHRADEDARLTETVLDRAGASSRQAVRIVDELADLARHNPRGPQPSPLGAPTPHGLSGPGR